MRITRTHDAQQDIWEVRHHPDITWRSWNGEVVVYDDLSGDTMKLDIIMSEIFRFMLPRPATRSQILDHLAAALDLKANDQLRPITAMALHRLREATLIQPATTAGFTDTR